MKKLMVRSHTVTMLAARLIAIVMFAALLSAAPFHAALAQTAPDLGSAADFAVLGGTAVTLTTSDVIGDVGSPTAVTVTGGTVVGTVYEGADAQPAYDDFLTAYGALAPQAGDCDLAHTLLSTITGPVTLLPGVYCTGAALTGTGVLTLDAQGDPDAVWIFKIGTGGTGALTGTGFSVVMANGGSACNVYWWVAQAVTMTTSKFKGNILAGAAITFNGPGSLTGRALAKTAVTMTDATVTGCGSSAPPPDSDYWNDYWNNYWYEYWKDNCKDYCKDYWKHYCKDYDKHHWKHHDNDNCWDDDRGCDRGCDRDRDRDRDKGNDKDNRNRR